MKKQTAQQSSSGPTEELTRGHKKKARTRQQLLDAALRIYARKGAGELALNELAEEAGVSNGTVYNYFRTREEVIDAVGIALAEELSHQVSAVNVRVTRGAQRVAIGVRTFIRKAQADPQWAKAVVGVIHYAAGMRSALTTDVRKDLQLGTAQEDFRYANETIAMDFVLSATMAAIMAIANGQRFERHDSVVAEMILLGLGVAAPEAKYTATLPMPASASSQETTTAPL